MSSDRLLSYLKRHIDSDKFKLLISAGVPLTGPSGLRRWVAERDVEAFAALYFESEFTLDIPPIHRKMFGSMQDVISRAKTARPGLKLARAIPRGHAKTTLHARILPLHGLLFGWSPLTVLLGNTQASAERLLMNVRGELETNDAILEDFGIVRGDVWAQNHIDGNGCTIRAFGVGNGAVRGVSKPGQRPSLVIGDDLDDDQSVRSPVQLEANTQWWDKAIMSLGDNITFTTSFIVVGTIIRKTSLMKHVLDSSDFRSIIEQGVKRFSDNSGLWDDWATWYIEQAKQGQAPSDPASDSFYQEHRDELLAGTAVLWERPDAYYQMMLYRLARGQAAFDSEVQNAPGASSQLLGAIPLMALPADLKGFVLLASLDPTIKGGLKNDKSAWVELLFHQLRKEVIIAFCNAEQRPAAKTVDYVINRMRLSMQPGAMRYDGLWCEENSAGSLIADSLEERSRNEGLFYSINRVHNSIAKEDRIAILGEYAARHQLFVADSIDSEFINEWEGFGSWKWDDALDAASTVLIALKDADLLDLIAVPY